MIKYGIFTGLGTVRFERLLPGPIERVWAYLTDSEKRGQWLASGEMDLRVGGKVELVFNNQHLTPHDDPIPEKYKTHGEISTLRGKITKLDPPNFLSFTWEEQSTPNSEVTFELVPKDNNVLLELTHRKLGDDRETLLSVGAGWHTHLGILADKLKGMEPNPFWSVYIQLEEEYRVRLNG